MYEITPSRAVFLDRDGVVIRATVRDGKPYPPSTIAELEFMPGVEEALLRLDKLGFVLFVVTNQPDVARGTQSAWMVNYMHVRLNASLFIREFLVCFHDDSDNCLCRKPKPGLILDAAKTHNIDLKESFLIGDRWRDIDAGWSAGCKTILIDYGYSERGPTHKPDIVVADITQAVDWIIGHSHPGNV